MLSWVTIAVPASVLLGWYLPPLGLGLVLASLAFGAQWVLPGGGAQPVAELFSTGHQVILLAAVAGYGLRRGLRFDVRPWPLIAILVLVVQTLALTDPATRPGPGRTAFVAFGLALPWIFVHLRYRPDDHLPILLAIALAAPLCVVLGLLMPWYGMIEWTLFAGDGRLQGVTNAGWLGCLAFAGFAAALHEALRAGRPWFAGLVALDLALALASGGRMATFACVVFGAIYILMSGALRERLSRLGGFLIVAGGGFLVFLIYAMPFLQRRMLGEDGVSLNLAGRDELWATLYTAFLQAPMVGRGLGWSSQVPSYFDLPHNEYLRLLADLGLLGLAIFAVAVVFWGRDILRLTTGQNRALAVALFASLAVFAFTDNILQMLPALAAFTLLGLASASATPARRKTGRRRSQRPPRRGRLAPPLPADETSWPRRRSARAGTIRPPTRPS